jgi:hypothetical protein
MPVSAPSTRLAAYVSVRLRPLAYLRVCADDERARECVQYAVSWYVPPRQYLRIYGGMRTHTQRYEDTHIEV